MLIFSANTAMKVRNMKQEYQSIYSKLTLDSKEKLFNGLITGGLSLIFAVIASMFNNTFLILLFSIISLILSAGGTISKLIKSIKKTKFDDSILIVIAILVSFFLGEFVIAATAMALYKLLGILITYITKKFFSLFNNVVNVLPEYANVVEDGLNIKRVLSQNLTRNMKIMVKTGEVVPVDCIISDGFSDFDTSNVYKSSMDVSLSSGDKLLAGFINIGTSVTCEAICDFDESLVLDLNRIASISETKKTKNEKRFSTIAKWYSPVILLVAAATLLIGGFTSGVWSTAILRACILFIIASTGTYVSTVPFLYSTAIWNLKKKGFSIASGDLLDELADINCVLFEKNGILTDGKYEIKDIYTAENISHEDFLMISAACIGGRNHPISSVLTKYMSQYIVAENVIEFPGKGVECSIMEKQFLCGSESFMQECGVDVSEITGYTIYVTLDKVLMGAMLIQDHVKSNSGDLVRGLRQVGIEKILMMSSERKETAELASVDCGADDYYAELSPQDRAEVIKKIKDDETLIAAYIGEETNGSQALNMADVGITLIHKDNNNIEFSDAVLLSDLETLSNAIELSRNLSGKLELHFYCTSAVKIILALLGLFGAVNIVAAIVVEAILSVITLISATDLISKK